MIEREQHYINLCKVSDREYGYNKSSIAGKVDMNDETRMKISRGNTGKIRTEEHLKHLSESHMGIKQSEETILKRTQKTIGMTRTEETKKIMSEKARARHGTTVELEQKIIKMYQDHVPMKEIEKESGKSMHTVYRVLKRNNISLYTDNPDFWSNKYPQQVDNRTEEEKIAEWKHKLSLARKGKPISDEHKQALIHANTGRIHSAEEIEKRAQKLRGRKRTPEQIQHIKDGVKASGKCVTE